MWIAKYLNKSVPVADFPVEGQNLLSMHWINHVPKQRQDVFLYVWEFFFRVLICPLRGKLQGSFLFFSPYPILCILISQRTNKTTSSFSHWCNYLCHLCYSDEEVNLWFAFVMPRWHCHTCGSWKKNPGQPGQRKQGWARAQARVDNVQQSLSFFFSPTVCYTFIQISQPEIRLCFAFSRNSSSSRIMTAQDVIAVLGYPCVSKQGQFHIFSPHYTLLMFSRVWHVLLIYFCLFDWVCDRSGNCFDF